MPRRRTPLLPPCAPNPPPPRPRQPSPRTQSGGGKARASRRGGRQGRGAGRGRRDCVPSAAVSGRQRDAGGLLSHSLLMRGCWSLNPRPCELRRRRRRGEASLGSGVPPAFQTACAPFLGSPRGAALSLPCHSLFISTSAPGDSLRPETSKPPPDGFGGPCIWQGARRVIITWETSKQQ